MKNVWRQRAAALMISTQLNPALANLGTLQPDPSTHRVTIVPLGDPNGSDERRAHRLLEARLKRWLENYPRAAVEAEVVQDRGSERAKAGLEVTTSLLRRALGASTKETGRLEDLYQDVQTRVAALGEDPTVGPLVQNAWVAISMYRWQRSDASGAKAALQKAIALHPEGKLLDSSLWEWESGPEVAAGYGELRTGVERSVRRNCELKFDRPESITLNGFAFPAVKSLHIVSGASYLFQTSTGPAKPVRCDGPGQIRVAVRHKRTPSVASESASARVAIFPQQDRFRLFLLSPESEVEEIPLLDPLRVETLLASRSESDLPIASDALAGLFPSVTPGWNASENRTPQGDQLRMTAEETEGKWYTDPSFWLVVGGLAAGFAAVYTLTRSSPVESSSHPVRVQLR